MTAFRHRTRFRQELMTADVCSGRAAKILASDDLKLCAARVSVRGMENLWLAAATGGVAALALLRLRQVSRWGRAEGDVSRHREVSGLGRDLHGTASADLLPAPRREGRICRAAQLHRGRATDRRTAADAISPDDPERAEWASLCTALLCIPVMVLQRAFRDMGLMV